MSTLLHIAGHSKHSSALFIAKHEINFQVEGWRQYRGKWVTLETALKICDLTEPDLKMPLQSISGARNLPEQEESNGLSFPSQWAGNIWLEKSRFSFKITAKGKPFPNYFHIRREDYHINMTQLLQMAGRKDHSGRS